MDNEAIEETSTSGDQSRVGNDNGKADQKEESNNDPNIILVTGLSDEISGHDLKKFLRQFGRVGKIKLMVIKTSLTSTRKLINCRFAHVSVPSGVSAHHLLEKINQVDRNLKGSRLEVTRAPESGPMSANYADSSVPKPISNGHGENDSDKPVEPADPTSNGKLNDENERGLLYSDQSSHNTPSPTPARAIGVTGVANEKQLISDGEITDECTGTDEVTGTDDTVSSSNQIKVNEKDHRQRRSDGGRKGKDEYAKEMSDRSRERRTSSVRSVINRRGVNKRPREESRSPPRRAGPGRNSVASSSSDSRDHNDRGRRGRSVVVTRKERVKRSPSPLERGRILSYEQIKEAQRQRDRLRRKLVIDGKCEKSQDRRSSSGNRNKRCSSRERRASRELQLLERAQQKIKEEREKMEMEKLELIQMQREQQRKEMEEIEREKERVRRAKQKLLKDQVSKTKTNRFGKTIAEQVIADLREKESFHELIDPSLRDRSRCKSIPPPSSSWRRRSPERQEGRYSHKLNSSWEDDDDYSPRKSKPRIVHSSVRSPEILFKGEGSLHRNRDHHHLASASSSSNSLGYYSSNSGRKDSAQDAVDEFLGKIGARTMINGSDIWKFGGGSGTGVSATVGTSVSEGIPTIRPSPQPNTFIDLLGNPYTITALSERAAGGGGFPRAGRLSDAIASLSQNQNDSSTSMSANGNQRNSDGCGGNNGGGFFSRTKHYKNDFQRYYSGS